MDPHRGLHDMHHDAAQVDQHPFAGVFTFHADDFAARLFDLVKNIVRQCLDLAGRFGAGNDHALEQRGEFAGVDNLNIACLDVFEGCDGDFLQFADVH